MLTLLPAPFRCFYRPAPCPVGDHLRTVGEETMIYEALPCTQCRVLNETAAEAFRRRPRLGQREREVLSALASPGMMRPLPAVSVTQLVVPGVRPAQANLAQSARVLAGRALAVVTHLPCVVVQRTGTPTLKDTAWIEATVLAAALITLPSGRLPAARRRAREMVIAQALAQTSDAQATLFDSYVDRVSRLLRYLIPALNWLHPLTQQRPRGRARLQACARALEHLRRVDAHRYALVIAQYNALLADHFLSAQCRSTTRDDHPDGDEYCRSGSRDREN